MALGDVSAADNWPPPPPVYHSESSTNGYKGNGPNRSPYVAPQRRSEERRSPWQGRQNQYRSPTPIPDRAEQRRLNPWSSGGVSSGYGNYPPLDGDVVRDSSRSSSRYGAREQLWSQWGKQPYSGQPYGGQYPQGIAPNWGGSNTPNYGFGPFNIDGLPNMGDIGVPDFGFPF